MYYKETVEKSYYAFRKLGLNVDVIDMEQNLDEYSIVAIPMCYMFRCGFEDKVRKFVKNGGTAIMTYWSGIVDDTDLCHLGGTPHALMDVFGLRSTEIDALYDWESNEMIPVGDNSLGIKKQWQCKNLCDLVEVSTAEVLGTYKSDFYKNMPAFTKNNYGTGQAYYVCADFEQGFYDEAYENIIKGLNIVRPVDNIPNGVEVTTRYSEEYEYIFVQNFNTQPVEIILDTQNAQIIFGNHVDNSIEGFGTIILKRKNIS